MNAQALLVTSFEHHFVECVQVRDFYGLRDLVAEHPDEKIGAIVAGLDDESRQWTRNVLNDPDNVDGSL